MRNLVPIICRDLRPRKAGHGRMRYNDGKAGSAVPVSSPAAMRHLRTRDNDTSAGRHTETDWRVPPPLVGLDIRLSDDGQPFLELGFLK